MSQLGIGPGSVLFVDKTVVVDDMTGKSVLYVDEATGRLVARVDRETAKRLELAAREQA